MSNEECAWTCCTCVIGALICADGIGNVLATGVQVYMSRKPLQVLLDQVPLADDDIVYHQSQALLRLQIPALGEGGHQEAGKGEETSGRKTKTRKITIFL